MQFAFLKHVRGSRVHSLMLVQCLLFLHSIAKPFIHWHLLSPLIYAEVAFGERLDPLGPLLHTLVQRPSSPRFKHVSHKLTLDSFARQTVVFWLVTDELTWKNLTGPNKCWSFPTPVKNDSWHSNDGPEASHIDIASWSSTWSPKMHSFALWKIFNRPCWRVWMFWRHKTVLLLA